MPNPILKRISPKGAFKFKLHKAPQDEQDLGLFNKKIYENLESAMREHPYLASYVNNLPEPPKYSLNAESEHGENEVNLIYPLGLGIYAHIIMNEESNKYNLVEPPTQNENY